MTTTVSRYQVRPERAEENRLLIEAVFAERDDGQLDGLRTRCFSSLTA